MPGSKIIQQKVSRPASQMLDEFSAAFDGQWLSAESTPWAQRFGYAVNSKFKHILPIPIDAPDVRRALGDPKYRRLFVGEMQFEPAPYEDGIEEDTDIIEAPDFSTATWQRASENMAKAFRQNLVKLVAALLEANGNLDMYTVRKPGGITASSIPMFSTSHLVHLGKPSKGTQSNLIAQGTYTDFNEALHTAVRMHFSSLKGADGKPMGLKAVAVLVPTGRIASAEKFYSRETVLEEGTNGVVQAPNIYRNAVEPIEVTDFTDADYVYYIAAGGNPWAVQDGGAPEEIRFDKDSDQWKKTHRVSIGYRTTQGVAGMMYHYIFRVDLKSSAR